MTLGGVMITDGGPHSAEYWASQTAKMLVPVTANLPGDKLIKAEELRLKVMHLLAPHHDANQKRERGFLAQVGDDHLAMPLTPEEVSEKALNEIVAAASGTPWETQFASDIWKDTARGVLRQHFATAQHIERQWHADRSQSPKAKAFKAQHHAAGQ